MNALLHQQPDGAWLVGGHLLHPASGALAAAWAEVIPELAGLGREDLLVMAGLGLGWHARAILDQPDSVNLLVFEPDPLQRALAAALGPDLAEVAIIGDEAELETRLAEALVYGQAQRARVFSPPALRSERPELGQRVAELVAGQVQRARVDRANRRAKQDVWLTHLADNFKHVLDTPDIASLAGRYAGVPALIIGAGPSLDASLPILAGHTFEHALTLTAASALGPLAKAGVHPDLALAIEAKDESRQFAGADPARTILAAASQSHPNHFQAWPVRRALFHLSPWLAAVAGTAPALPNGGHVTSVAFSLAVLLGCDPIVLVGQDLAYSQGRAYASGRAGGLEADLPGLVSAPAIGGGSVETSAVMAGYIAWYREAAAYLAGRSQPVRLINATAAGARLEGFEHLTLAASLAVLREDGARHVSLAANLDRLKLPTAETVGQGLAEVRIQVRRALAQANTATFNQLLEAWPSATAVGEALRRLPASVDPDQVRTALERLAELVGRMWEGLYA